MEETLAELPSLARLLPPPSVEGVNSEAFPGVLRKTNREVYRWIANTHYGHLAGAVPCLDRVHAEGCLFGNLLTTTSREQFVSHTTEVLVADDLLRRGYGVRTIPRSGHASPDLLIECSHLDLAVEVYAPRELLAVDEWVREVSDLLSYVDIPASFRSRVETAFDEAPPTEPWRLDPWAPNKMLEVTSRGVIAEVKHDVEKALRKLHRFHKVYRHPETPLQTTVELDYVRPSPEEGPAREGSISAPGFSGYSPGGVFRTIVERAIKKARRRQTQGVDAAARALVVSLDRTMIASDLKHPVHMSEAKSQLDGIEPKRYGLDVITFVTRVQEGLGQMLTVMDDEVLSTADVMAMFDERSNASA